MTGKPSAFMSRNPNGLAGAEVAVALDVGATTTSPTRRPDDWVRAADAAHDDGGGFVLENGHRHRVRGVHRADSHTHHARVRGMRQPLTKNSGLEIGRDTQKKFHGHPVLQDN